MPYNGEGYVVLKYKKKINPQPMAASLVTRVVTRGGRMYRVPLSKGAPSSPGVAGGGLECLHTPPGFVADAAAELRLAQIMAGGVEISGGVLAQICFGRGLQERMRVQHSRRVGRQGKLELDFDGLHQDARCLLGDECSAAARARQTDAPAPKAPA